MGNKRWNSLEAPDSVLFPWDLKSTYIRCPSFFDKLVSTVLLLDLPRAAWSCKTLSGVNAFNCSHLLDQRARCHPAYWKCPRPPVSGRLRDDRSHLACRQHCQEQLSGQVLDPQRVGVRPGACAQPPHWWHAAYLLGPFLWPVNTVDSWTTPINKQHRKAIFLGCYALSSISCSLAAL